MSAAEPPRGASRWKTVLAAAATVFCTTVAAEDRAAIDDRYKWNLAEIYANEAAWDKARMELLVDIARLASTKPQRFRTAGELVAALALRDRIGERGSRLSVYASMRHDLDTRDGRGQQMDQQAREAIVAFTAAAAWIRPAILALGAAKVRAFISADPRLVPWRQPARRHAAVHVAHARCTGREVARPDRLDRGCRRGGVVGLHQCRPAVARGDAVGRAKSAARRKRV